MWRHAPGKSRLTRAEIFQFIDEVIKLDLFYPFAGRL